MVKPIIATKFISWKELSDGRIQCEYGRVGKNMVTVYKNSNEWNKILKSFLILKVILM
jgi:hypothetical protein